jgi:hypothetical protein
MLFDQIAIRRKSHSWSLEIVDLKKIEGVSINIVSDKPLKSDSLLSLVKVH